MHQLRICPLYCYLLVSFINMTIIKAELASQYLSTSNSLCQFWFLYWTKSNRRILANKQWPRFPRALQLLCATPIMQSSCKFGSADYLNCVYSCLASLECYKASTDKSGPIYLIFLFHQTFYTGVTLPTSVDFFLIYTSVRMNRIMPSVL